MIPGNDSTPPVIMFADPRWRQLLRLFILCDWNVFGSFKMHLLENCFNATGCDNFPINQKNCLIERSPGELPQGGNIRFFSAICGFIVGNYSNPSINLTLLFAHATILKHLFATSANYAAFFSHSFLPTVRSIFTETMQKS